MRSKVLYKLFLIFLKLEGFNVKAPIQLRHALNKRALKLTPTH